MSILIHLLGDLVVLAISLMTFAFVHIICNRFNLPEPYAFILSVLWSCYPLGMSVVRQVVSGFYTSSYLATHRRIYEGLFL